MTLSSQPYKGTRDYFPEDKRTQNYIFNTWRKAVESFGYEEYGAPILEPIDIYAAKSGQELVNDQTYVFSDRGGRTVAIRPEMTPTISRMVAARRQELAYPARLYSIANFMRYERPQRGREREFWQLNVDIFGVDDVAADIEIITIADTILKSFGGKDGDYVIRINNRKFINFMMSQYLGLDEVQAQQMTKLFDRRNKITEQDFKEQAMLIFGDVSADDERFEKVTQLVTATSIDSLPEELKTSAALDELQTVFAGVAKAGVTAAVFDASLMRGLDYYTGTVFEVFDTHPDNNRSLFGGGRYDGLVGLFGAEPISAVGMAPGNTMIENFLAVRGLIPEQKSLTNVYVVVIDDAFDTANTVASQLRGAGINTEVDITTRKIDKKIKSATKKNIEHVLFVGPNDIEAFSFKNLLSEEEQNSQLLRLLRDLLRVSTSVIISQMETTLTYLSDTKVTLTITVGALELDEAEQVALVKLSKTTKVPGFRAGKVPASIAAKHVDPKALQEQTLDDALSRAVAEAFAREKLQPLDRPTVEVKKFVPGEILEFTAEVEVLPKVELGEYKKLSAKQEKASVSAKEIDDTIERMRVAQATKKEVKRAAKDGDEVVIDFVGKKDGVAFDGGTATDYTLKLGGGQFIPGFEEGIVGHKLDETFDIDLKFPKDYHSSDLAGTAVTFTVTLNKILEATLPTVDDTFAAAAGPFKNLQELKDDIKRELKNQKERETGEKFKDALITELVEKSKVPVPEVLVEDQMRSIERDFEQNLMYQGLTIDSYLATNGFKDIETWREKEVRPTALKRVQAGLVLAELTNAEKVSATEAEIDEHVEVHKQQYQNNPEALKQFETPEVRRDIANHFVTEKTIERLIALNK